MLKAGGLALRSAAYFSITNKSLQFLVKLHIVHMEVENRTLPKKNFFWKFWTLSSKKYRHCTDPYSTMLLRVCADGCRKPEKGVATFQWDTGGLSNALWKAKNKKTNWQFGQSPKERWPHFVSKTRKWSPHDQLQRPQQPHLRQLRQLPQLWLPQQLAGRFFLWSALFYLERV